MISLITKLIGTRNDRLVKKMRHRVSKINELEPHFQALDDDGLRAKTQDFRARLSKGESLESLLPEAFAVVREASFRVLGMRHFDVQLIGGMVLHQGNIAEMRTGEGKTLMATLAAYLNALPEKGVHIITVNDYLAERDCQWMRPVYESLGLTVGVNISTLSPEEKQAAYQCDITYGTNNEFGFDYLRDNMAFRMEDRVQRIEPNFAIVDEVDSILIDEARTPLIISGPAEDSSKLYKAINKFVPELVRQESEEADDGDFSVDEKNKQVHLTEAGHQKVEALLTKAALIQEGESLYDYNNITLMHHFNAALRAHVLYHKDVDYIVRNQEVIIVDEHTGRLMAGRRWSDGLHQAVEAKEGVLIQQENQTLASITFQNYFRLYNKLSGMTGTADTEAYELQEIYGLEVVIIPTNRPIARQDLPDLVYGTQIEKFNAVVEEIKEKIANGQPILVGTASIESSEHVSQLLKQANVAHEVLNAKQHGREATIIAQAGQPGSVTIATNMAGRGTDIVLGGNFEAELKALDHEPSAEEKAKLEAAWQQRQDQVIAAGGLHIVATERHESRRIDNQLRGRAGRQGDPGSSRFYLSLEDNLMRIFASERVANMMKSLGMKEGVALESSMVSRSIEKAQKKVEGHNFDIRKHLLEYDDVANDQRRVIYEQRLELLQHDDISETLAVIREDVIENFVGQFIPPGSLEEQWDVTGLESALQSDFNLNLPVAQWLESEDHLDEEQLRARVLQENITHYQQKMESFDQEIVHQVEKNVTLQNLDTHWKEHLNAMDYLRQGINLRSYAQVNPTQEYKREAFNLFSHMLNGLKMDIISILAKLEIQLEDPQAMEVEAARAQQAATQSMNFIHGDVVDGNSQEPLSSSATQPFVRSGDKIGRNDPCHCGSGRKYKQCHGKLA